MLWHQLPVLVTSTPICFHQAPAATSTQFVHCGRIPYRSRSRSGPEAWGCLDSRRGDTLARSLNRIEARLAGRMLNDALNRFREQSKMHRFPALPLTLRLDQRTALRKLDQPARPRRHTRRKLLHRQRSLRPVPNRRHLAIPRVHLAKPTHPLLHLLPLPHVTGPQQNPQHRLATPILLALLPHLENAKLRTLEIRVPQQAVQPETDAAEQHVPLAAIFDRPQHRRQSPVVGQVSLALGAAPFAAAGFGGGGAGGRRAVARRGGATYGALRPPVLELTEGGLEISA